MLGGVIILLKEIADIVFSFPDNKDGQINDWIYPAFLQEDNIISQVKTESNMRPNSLCKVAKGDIIIKRIEPQFVNYVSEDMNAYIGQNVVIVRGRENVNAKYLAYILEKNLNALYRDSTGAVLTAVSRKSFDDITIKDLPNMRTQIAIGELWWLQKEKNKLRKQLCEKETKLLRYKLKNYDI